MSPATLAALDAFVQGETDTITAADVEAALTEIEDLRETLAEAGHLAGATSARWRWDAEDRAWELRAWSGARSWEAGYVSQAPGVGWLVRATPDRRADARAAGRINEHRYVTPHAYSWRDNMRLVESVLADFAAPVETVGGAS